MERFSTPLDAELGRDDSSHYVPCSLDPSDYQWGQDVDPYQKQALYKQFSSMAQNVAMLFYSFFPSLPLSPGCPMPPWLLQVPAAHMPLGNVAPVPTTKCASRFPIANDRQSSNDSVDGNASGKQSVRPGISNGSNNTTSSKKRGSPSGDLDQKRSQSRRKPSIEVVQVSPPAPPVAIKVEETVGTCWVNDAHTNMAGAATTLALPLREVKIASGLNVKREDPSTDSNEETEQVVDYLDLAFGSFLGDDKGDEAVKDELPADVPGGLLLAMQSHEKREEEDALGLDLGCGWNTSGGGLLLDDVLTWNQGGDFGLEL